MLTHPVEKVDAPRELAPNLWILDSDWGGASFRRRMTVIRLASGELVVHSAVALTSELTAWLDGLGPVRWIIVPNAFHDSEAEWFARHAPDAVVLVPQALLLKLRQRFGRTVEVRSIESAWPRSISDELKSVVVDGTRILHEAVFLHAPSETLILTDLAFHMEDHAFKSAVERFLMRLNRVGGGKFGPSWLAANFFFKEDHAIAESLRKIDRWDFDRIIVSHGSIVETGGKAEFRRAYARWLGA